MSKKEIDQSVSGDEKNRKTKYEILEFLHDFGIILTNTSLLVAMFFSYLGWQEARKAYELQRSIFKSTSLPKLDVQKVDLSEDKKNIIVDIKNNGLSVAQQVCIEFWSMNFGKRITCGAEKNDLPPGSSTYFLIENLEKFEPKVDSFQNFRIFWEKERFCKSGAFVTVSVQISYKDATEASVVGNEIYIVCVSHPLK